MERSVEGLEKKETFLRLDSKNQVNMVVMGGRGTKGLKGYVYYGLLLSPRIGSRVRNIVNNKQYGFS